MFFFTNDTLSHFSGCNVLLATSIGKVQYSLVWLNIGSLGAMERAVGLNNLCKMSVDLLEMRWLDGVP